MAVTPQKAKVILTGPAWAGDKRGLVLDAELEKPDGWGTWYRTVHEESALNHWYVNVADPDDDFGGELLLPPAAVNRMQAQVRGFHEAFGAPVADEPQLIKTERADLRYALILEELHEYGDAYEVGNLTEIADALGDLLYVVFGAAIEHGINLQPVVDEIHRSNMSKLGDDGKPVYRADGKILKGPTYSPPNLEPVLAAQKKEN